MVEYEGIDPKEKIVVPTYNVAITFLDNETLLYRGVRKTEPRQNFLLVGFEDHTIIIPDHQIKVATVRLNQEDCDQ